MDKVDPKILARQIDAYCAANGISKAEFAENTGISTATLSQWRKGLYDPSEKSIAAIEDYMNMPIEALIGGKPSTYPFAPVPTISDDTVQFPVIGGVAAGYDHIAYEDWTGDNLEIPRSYLKGRNPQDYFILKVRGNSMYPDYQEGDHVLVLRQSTMDRSGQIGVVIYGDENATLKRIEYVEGEDWVTLRPVNPQYPPITIRGEALEHCTVLGVAKMVIREIMQ